MKNVLEYLERTEQRCGTRLAVDDGITRYTYHELMVLSRKIGSALVSVLDTGQPVVVFMEKGSLTLAAMFGVVYAGCFYVAVNPEQPPERIQKILEVLEPGAVISTGENRRLFKEMGWNGSFFHIEQLVHGYMDMRRLKRIRKNAKSTDILYGVFTSGSTGVPKGIVVSHQAVLSFIGHFTELFHISEKDKIGNQAPFDFDVSVKDIYSAMKTGAALILIPREMFVVPSQLLDYLCEKQVTTLIWAVSALCVISGLKGLEYRVPHTVNKILFSGECMPVNQLKLWQKALPNAVFYNLYGPSEITCNCTWYRIERMFQEEEKIPIGNAFPGRSVFLLDENGGQIRNAGKRGEICVGGESLANGYYRAPEQTRERFFYYPIDGREPRRVYRTGDLGYFGENGELYFAGRKDFQIKHMGHRIELEEIERAIMGASGVNQICCTFERERNRILAFYSGEAESLEIRKELRKKLPAYMLPSRLIRMEQLPMNKNGKTDRQYLLQKAGELEK